MAYAKFKAHQFMFLNITNIGSDYVLKGSECGLACVNIPSCFSFNLAAFSDINNGKILCELLPSDIYNNSQNFVASQFYHHYSITVSDNSTENFKHFFCRWHLWQSAKTCVKGKGERKRKDKKKRKDQNTTKNSEYFLIHSVSSKAHATFQKVQLLLNLHCIKC